jgi:hypothetical protein
MALLQKVVKVQTLARKCSKKIASDLAKAAKVNDLQLPNDNQSSTQL